VITKAGHPVTASDQHHARFITSHVHNGILQLHDAIPCEDVGNPRPYFHDKRKQRPPKIHDRISWFFAVCVTDSRVLDTILTTHWPMIGSGQSADFWTKMHTKKPPIECC